MSEDQRGAERRRFTRVLFDSTVRISDARGTWSGKLVDISMKGVLCEVPTDWPGQVGERFTILLSLDEADAQITMQGRIAHVENQRVGLAWEQIDLDSFTHLKRLLQLNLENEAQLLRELEELG